MKPSYLYPTLWTHSELHYILLNQILHWKYDDDAMVVITKYEALFE